MAGIREGDRLPRFKLPNQDGKIIDIARLTEQWLVIYFYPKDDTPGCTKEACTFRDQYHLFTDAGAKVFGVSADSITSHKKFKVKYRLPFDLLSDENNNVRKLFGVPSDLFGLIPGRVTYVVDPKGIVRLVFNSQLNTSKHVEKALEIIRGN